MLSANCEGGLTCEVNEADDESRLNEVCFKPETSARGVGSFSSAKVSPERHWSLDGLRHSISVPDFMMCGFLLE